MATVQLLADDSTEPSAEFSLETMTTLSITPPISRAGLDSTDSVILQKKTSDDVWIGVFNLNYFTSPANFQANGTYRVVPNPSGCGCDSD